MNNYIYSYYQKINDGTETVGQWIKLLYEKIVSGIEDGLTSLINTRRIRLSSSSSNFAGIIRASSHRDV